MLLTSTALQVEVNNAQQNSFKQQPSSASAETASFPLREETAVVFVLDDPFVCLCS